MKEVVGGGRGRGRKQGAGGLGLSLDQYSHLLPAGPGRTLRSETHLLADIKPPFLPPESPSCGPSPPPILFPPRARSSLGLPSFRPSLLAGQPSRRTLRDLHPVRDGRRCRGSLAQGGKFCRSFPRRSHVFTAKIRRCFSTARMYGCLDQRYRVTVGSAISELRGVSLRLLIWHVG